MNICFVDMKLTKGGSGRVISILANYFSEKKYGVSIVTLDSDRIDYGISDNVSVFNLDMKKNNNLIKLGIELVRLKKVLDTQDVIVAFCFRPIFWVTLATLKKKSIVIYSERNNPYKDPNNVLKRFLRNICYLHADHIVFQTSEQQSYFFSKISRKGKIIKNPVESNLPFYVDDSKEKIVISASRLEKQKNIYMAIKAFSLFHDKHSDYIFNIYGDGNLKSELTDYISSIGLNKEISIFDFTPKIHEAMCKASIFILSSDYEGISNSMLEAMAIGIPVICTDCPVGGAREFIVNEENGVLVDVGDYEQMAFYMNKIVEDDVFRKKISSNSKAIRECVSADSICKEWEQLIRREYSKRSSA